MSWVLCSPGCSSSSTLLRMGWMSQFLSKAVVKGFLFGATLEVTVGELPKLTGTSADGTSTWREFGSWNGSPSVTPTSRRSSSACCRSGSFWVFASGSAERPGPGTRRPWDPWRHVCSTSRSLWSVTCPAACHPWSCLTSPISRPISRSLFRRQSGLCSSAFPNLRETPGSAWYGYRVEINRVRRSRSCRVGSGMVQGIQLQLASRPARSMTSQAQARCPPWSRVSWSC